MTDHVSTIGQRVRAAAAGRSLAAARALAVVSGALWLAAAGCGGPGGVDAKYGLRRGATGGASVNGTAVLAGMFEAAGHRVTSWRRLSPRLEQFDVLVWAPDAFDPPTEEVREYLEDWLRQRPGRTLVYIGRDYDAAADYWRGVQPLAPPDQALEVRRRLAEARADHDQARARMPADQYARWFVVRRGDGRRQARDLDSPAGDWLAGVDAARTGIVIEGWLDVPTAQDVPRARRSDLPDSQVLLRADGRPLVTRVTDRGWQGSQILVVANGSFLLNLPLVNHQHRILAGKLIDACGQPGEVAFLESGAEGLTVFEQEPDTAYPTGAELFTVWPLGAIALHLVALGILYCYAEFPIFGRPRTQYSLTPVAAGQAAIATVLNLVINVQRPEPPKGQSDFGSHVQALGELLRRGGDTQYAQARLNYYHQHVKRDSAASLSEPAGSTTTAPPAPVR